MDIINEDKTLTKFYSTIKVDNEIKKVILEQLARLCCPSDVGKTGEFPRSSTSYCPNDNDHLGCYNCWMNCFQDIIFVEFNQEIDENNLNLYIKNLLKISNIEGYENLKTDIVYQFYEEICPETINKNQGISKKECDDINNRNCRTCWERTLKDIYVFKVNTIKEAANE